MDLINVAQGRDKWRALVNTVMNLLVPSNTGKFFSNCRIDNLSSIKLVSLVCGVAVYCKTSAVRNAVCMMVRLGFPVFR
jgi:hypothetical protein